MEHSLLGSEKDTESSKFKTERIMKKDKDKISMG